MKLLVEKFNFQLKDALKIGESANLKKTTKKFKNVVITGLGGSGIGGKIVSQLVQDKVTVPININNDYSLPAYVDDHTLLIASSFSGNTEETLSALSKAMEKGAEIACITSGGKLAQIAKDNNYNHIILPTERSPRAMLTYSLVQQFYLLHHYDFIDSSFKKDIENAITLLDKELATIKEKAHEVALSLHHKTAVLYSDSAFEGVTTRLRQQINENAKALCWHHVVPEMNHNELVGWAGGKNEYAVVVLRSSFDHPRTKLRLNISKEIISKYTSVYFEIEAKGNSKTEQALFLILFGDWVSVYLSELYQVDSIEVNVIDYLKKELSKI